MSPESAAIIGTVVGAILATIPAYFLAVCLAKRNDRLAATVAFRTAFLDEIAICRRDPGDDAIPAKIFAAIDAAHSKHEKAFLLFSPFVISKGNIDDFEKVWGEYSDKYKRLEICTKYSGRDSHDHDTLVYVARHEKEMRAIILTRIEKLFEFAPLPF